MKILATLEAHVKLISVHELVLQKERKMHVVEEKQVACQARWMHEVKLEKLFKKHKSAKRLLQDNEPEKMHFICTLKKRC